ncbi:hypothetical protein AB4Y32_03390 [Paraburkholderia phymatum]|uniref:Uncharacterized protein n=1 Tax=Paraburkholderia phymatum TaxID=148447 RepID=A0ACC6TU41_9BURK
MPASAAIAISASSVVSATPSVLGDHISAGVWSLIGSAFGAGAAYLVARYQQKAQSDRERLKAAHDSASSHMANVAFDKYVEFCEAYKDAAGEGVMILIQHGPTREIIGATHKLTEIRVKYSLWIPTDIDARLFEFEKVWLSIGAFSPIIDSTVGGPAYAETREKYSNMVYKEFAKAMGLNEWDGEKLSDEFTLQSIVAGLREVLGTEKITKLRRNVLDRASSELG